MTPPNASPERSPNLVEKLQQRLKRNGRLYNFLIRTLAPAHTSPESLSAMRELLDRHGPGSTVVNIGSGPQSETLRSDIINLDIEAYSKVGIVGDAMNLPLADGSVDLILCVSMLEHLPDPVAAVREMHRVLKPDGEIYCDVPFIQPFHAAPHDYCRYTRRGLAHLFRDFADARIGISSGAASGLLWVGQEWLALALSFGNDKVRDVLLLGLMVLTAPFKLLDKLLNRLPGTHVIASAFFITARRP